MRFTGRTPSKLLKLFLLLVSLVRKPERNALEGSVGNHGKQRDVNQIKLPVFSANPKGMIKKIGHIKILVAISPLLTFY